MAVARTADRVLRDAALGGERAGDAVEARARVGGGRDVGQQTGQSLERRHVGIERAHGLLVPHHAQQIAIQPRFDGTGPQCPFHRVGDGRGRELVCGEVHREDLAAVIFALAVAAVIAVAAPPRYGQHTAQRAEPHLVGFRFHEVQHHVCGGECRMPAQVDLAARREPAQMPSFWFAHDERGLGEPVLHRDVRHQLVARPRLR